MDFDFFCDIFEKLLSPSQLDRLLKLVHSIFDFNDDRLIDELDAYCFYCTYERESPDHFMLLFYDDWIRVIKRLQQKKIDKGYTNREIDMKLKKIQN